MQVLNGFVKIHRKLIQWGWYQDNVVKGVFLHLLLTASFKDAPWQGRIIKKGQVITSNKRLAEDLGFTTKQVRTALDKLKSTGEIICEGTNKYTLVTVVNWEEYQYLEENRANEGQALSVTKVLQSLNNLKNTASKTANKKSLETLLNIEIDKIENLISASNMANEGQTKGKQRANEGQHRKNVKEYKECKEKKKGPDGPDFWGLTFDDEEEGEGNDQEGDVRPAEHH